MHDPTSLFRFDEHDLYLPIATLEELDQHKRGLSDVSRNARQASRFLDEIVTRRRHQEGPARSRPRTARRRRGACSCRPRRSTASCRRPSPRARPTTRSSAVVRYLQDKRAAARGGAGVERHQHAHQGARAGPAGRGLLQRQGARGRRPPLHRRAPAAARLLELARQGHGVVEEGRPHLLPRARAAGAEAARQRVRLRRVGRAPAVRAGQGGGRTASRCSRRCATTPTPRTRCGASPRATASRTSRSTC